MEIEVTEKMIEEGRREFWEHKYDTDIPYMLESVFRAMSYANVRSASSSKDDI